MKIWILTLLLSAFFSHSNLMGQIGPYKLQVLQDVYVPLSNGTEIDTGNDNGPWSDPSFNFPVGFDFNLFEFYYDTVYSLNVQYYINSPDAISSFELGAALYPLLEDLIDRGTLNLDSVSQSPIRYQLDGDVGDRILKYEMANAGFNFEPNDSSVSYVNFQYWLYEIDGAIEYRYGPSFIETHEVYSIGEGGPVVGLLDSTGDFF